MTVTLLRLGAGRTGWDRRWARWADLCGAGQANEARTHKSKSCIVCSHWRCNWHCMYLIISELTRCVHSIKQREGEKATWASTANENYNSSPGWQQLTRLAPPPKETHLVSCFSLLNLNSLQLFFIIGTHITTSPKFISSIMYLQHTKITS